MRKRIISCILVIAILFSIFMPVYADNSDNKHPISPYGDEMFEYLLTDNHKLLVIRNNYGYMQFADDFRQNAWSLYLLEMTDLLIETGAKPDKLKYMEVLINIIGTYELDNAADISAQKKMDNLKSVEDYAMDIVDIGTNAVAVMAENNPAVSKFEEGISNAIDRISKLKDNVNNWAEAFSNLETIVEDYSKYDAFLALIEEKADGELKEAAATLRSGMSKAFEIKLDIYADVSDENFQNYSEMFFGDIFWKVLKQTEDYENDEAFKAFVDVGDDLVSKIDYLKSSWELGLGIGKLVGNVTVGGENLINRVLEILALSDISVILQSEITELATEFLVEIGTSEEAKKVDNYIVLAQYLIGARIRGEYCMYSIVANDAGLLSWFNKKSAEEAKAWYELKTRKILDIQSELLKIKKNSINNNESSDVEIIDDKNIGELTIKQICQIVTDYYNEYYDVEDYVVFEGECMVTDEGYNLILRWQGGNTANVFVTILNINIDSGEVREDGGYSWNLYEYMNRNTILLDGYWENNIQCKNYYKFYEDGTVKECFIDADGTIIHDEDFIFKYNFDGNVLILEIDGGQIELEPVTTDSLVNWDSGLVNQINKIPKNTVFFYETSWNDEEILGNAMYLKKSNISEIFDVWEEFLISGEYKKYISDDLDMNELEYVIYDINNDDALELLIQSTSERPFITTWLFVLEEESIKLIDEPFYGYGSWRYSSHINAIIASPEWKPFNGNGYSPFYYLNKTGLEFAYEIVQDEGIWYYIGKNKKIELSEEEKDSYFKNVVWFEWLPIGTIVSDKGI